jgi:hypothetical protein
MSHRDCRWINLVEDVNILSRVLWLHHGHSVGEYALLAIRQQVCVLDIPTRSRFKDNALKPHGIRGEVLNVDFKEDL